jgi:hypothetical protein
MSPKLSVLIPCALIALLAVTATPAAAQEESVDCGFLEIRASSGETAKLASELKVLEKKLKRPPFSSWNIFDLLSSTQQALPKLKAKTLKLTDGQATVLYRDTEGKEGKDGKKKRRLALTVTMDDKDGKRVVDIKVNVDSEDYVVVGRSIDNGKNGHVLALSCR